MTERKAAGKSIVRSGIKAALRTIVIGLVCAGTGVSNAQPADANSASAAALRARYGLLRDQLGNNPFQKPIYLESAETPDSVTGDIHALIEAPFATVNASLNSAGNWCEIMMLHLNTKYCRASAVNPREVLNVSIGKKYDQVLDDAYRVVFAYHIAAQTPSYLRVQLKADEGPLSTRDYRIVLEAIPLERGQTFMRLSYSYHYGLAGRLAMQAYLGTIGRNKVGFTVTGRQSSGAPLHIGGMRGVMERNTMRYYLAIESFLGALSVPPQARREKGLHDWFAAIERYPRQLHEMALNEYLDMKRREFLRLDGVAPLRAPG
ncbi:MAG: hypothetical protein ABL891_18670 [Burkholderiales bacterium]